VPGWLSPDQVSDLWLRGDIFVLPSMIENLPLSINRGVCAWGAGDLHAGRVDSRNCRGRPNRADRSSRRQ
jgi:hypothetical protein